MKYILKGGSLPVWGRPIGTNCPGAENGGLNHAQDRPFLQNVVENLRF